MIPTAKSDGSVIIDTKLNTDGFGKSVSSLKGQFGSLGSAAKKLGGLIAAAFSVKVLVDFGKEAIQLGSDLQEVQNVVDVTFTTMNQQVNEFAKNAAMTAGLSETMAKRYTGTFGAMAKSFGFSEAEAYNMSTALTQLSGDVASFYNLSQDAAYTKLKSVFTGETESLKDLGVVMTQTALDDFALRKGLGKTTSQMSEQEKVALRYQFVVEQLSGASGDFVRTQDSWANQTKILNLQFEQLKATLGQGLINVLTPVLKTLNTLIGKLQEFAVVFKNVTQALFGNASSGNTGGVEESLGSAAGNAESLEENITQAGKAAKKAVAGFDEINTLTSTTVADTSGTTTPSATNGSGSSNNENVLSPGLVAAIENVKALIDGIGDLLEPIKNIDLTPLANSFSALKGPLGELAGVIGENLRNAWDNVLVPLATWTIEDAAPAAVDAFKGALDLLQIVLDGLQPFGIWLWEDFLKPIANWTGKKAIEGLNSLGDALTGISDWIKENQEPVNNLVTVLGSIAGSVGAISVAAKIAEYVAAVAAMAPEVGLLAAMFPKLSGAIASLGSWITGTLVPAITGGLSAIAAALGISVGWLVAIIAAVAAAVAAIIIYWDEISAFFSELWANISTWASTAWTSISASASQAWEWISVGASDCWSAIVEFFSPAAEWFAELFGSIWQTISDVFYNIGVIASGCWEVIKVAWNGVATWFDENVCQPVGNFFSGMWDGVTKGAKAAWEGVKKAFSGVATFFSDTFKKAWEGVLKVFSPIGKIFVDIKDGILSAFKTVVNGLIKGLNSLIEIPFNGINTALKWIKGIEIVGIKPFDKLKTISVPQIPYLAQGAVIPPNAPFMAVLGDQKHGTNIEAPLETIKQALAEVLAMQGGAGEMDVNVNFTGSLAQLVRLLIPEIEVEYRRKGGSLATGGAY